MKIDLACVLLAAGLVADACCAAAAKRTKCPKPEQPIALPQFTTSGYVNVSDEPGSGALFYAYYEAMKGVDSAASPVIVWLQGGPGCSSLLGSFYELGPERINARLGLESNGASWSRRAGLLMIDQPVGTGFSVTGDDGRIPVDEMAVAADLYSALQAIFVRHEALQRRAVIIAGESYAGKYVPSIGHFILQQEVELGGSGAALRRLRHRRRVPERLLSSRSALRRPPAFQLRGLVIGNGLTDPALQVMTHADCAFAMGLIDASQRTAAMRRQLEIAQLIAARLWGLAHAKREKLLEYLAEASGAATLLDVRRAEDYDANKTVDCYFDLPEEALGVPAGKRFESCSEEVGDALGPDVMQSVAYLIPDLLETLPMLLYQGAFDIQDGPASSSAWIEALDWPGRGRFSGSRRHIIRETDISPPSVWRPPAKGSASSGAVLPGMQSSSLRTLQADVASSHGGGGDRVVAYWKSHATLTHVVLRSSGHLVPHDDPLTSQWMLEKWVSDEVLGAAAA